MEEFIAFIARPKSKGNVIRLLRAAKTAESGGPRCHSIRRTQQPPMRGAAQSLRPLKRAFCQTPTPFSLLLPGRIQPVLKLLIILGPRLVHKKWGEKSL